MRLVPLGDQAVMAYCPDEASATIYADQVRHASFPWVLDVVQAYTSVAVFYDLGQTSYSTASTRLEGVEKKGAAAKIGGRRFQVPCCYGLGLDWPRLTELTGLTKDTIIKLHSETVFTVYAIGFCPGFPYMGYLPDPIARVPRLPSPRLKVEAGSVGLTGRQTGIYTEDRPGGWNIIGRTPLELVNVRDGYFPLRTGDQVQFEPISEKTFRRRLGERLGSPNSPA